MSPAFSLGWLLLTSSHQSDSSLLYLDSSEQCGLLLDSLFASSRVERNSQAHRLESELGQGASESGCLAGRGAVGPADKSLNCAIRPTEDCMNDGHRHRRLSCGSYVWGCRCRAQVGGSRKAEPSANWVVDLLAFRQHQLACNRCPELTGTDRFPVRYYRSRTHRTCRHDVATILYINLQLRPAVGAPERSMPSMARWPSNL